VSFAPVYNEHSRALILGMHNSSGNLTAETVTVTIPEGYTVRQTIRLDESDALTASMVNNYTKNALVPRAEGKKYNRDHLAYLTFVCILKQVMSVRDMDLLIRTELSDDRSVENGYRAVRAEQHLQRRYV